MRIYGGHDYYDCALSLGIDPTIILLRGKSKSVAVDKAGGSLLGRSLVLIPQHTTLSRSVSIENVAVAFCGKVYRGIMGSGFGKREEIWSADKARTFVAQEKNRKIEVQTHWHYFKEKKMTLEEWFTPFESPKPLLDYMIANKISILVEEPPKYHYDEKCFQVNPYTLKQLGFAKALDPYTAFQELSMWIGGVLGGTSPEIVTIKDDKTLIENHGFDNRFSFRGPRI